LTDCDDTRARVYPGSGEMCDAANVDEDCDGLADDFDSLPSDPGTYHYDSDGDGFGDPDTVGQRCDATVTWIADASDCDDTRADVNPSRTEVAGNGIDDDCDGWSAPGPDDTDVPDTDVPDTDAPHDSAETGNDTADTDVDGDDSDADPVDTDGHDTDAGSSRGWETAELDKEPLTLGGCGCASGGAPGPFAAWIAVFLARRRRGQSRAV
jgi:MYXO-CTERM domain-containing protein